LLATSEIPNDIVQNLEKVKKKSALLSLPVSCEVPKVRDDTAKEDRWSQMATHCNLKKIQKGIAAVLDQRRTISAVFGVDSSVRCSTERARRLDRFLRVVPSSREITLASTWVGSQPHSLIAARVLVVPSFEVFLGSQHQR